VLSAAFGVGGATISTPAIRALGAPALVAVGTTLPSILPSAVSGSLRYRREGLIDRRIVMWTVPAGIAMSVLGSLLSHLVPGDGHWLMIFTAAMLGFTAWRMSKAPPAAEGTAAAALEPLPGEEERAGAAEHEPSRAPAQASTTVLVGTGVVAGLLSGLLGVGGGIVMVPAFTELGRIPIKIAIASSLVCVGLFAVPGTITHTALGGIDWRFALLLAVGVVPGARIGAAAVMRTGDRRLRITVATFLAVIAVIYAAGEVLALAR
jgi:uncharacterized membrane protein YfcA